MWIPKIIISIVLYSLGVFLYAQGYNFSYKPVGKNIANGRKIQSHPEGVMQILSVQEFSPAKIGHCAVVVNTIGQILSENCLTDTVVHFADGAISGLDILPDKTYIFAGSITENNTNTTPMTYRIQSDGSLIDSIRFQSTVGSLGGVMGRYILWDNSIIVLSQTSHLPDIYLIKYDINFNIIWHKQVSQLYNQEPIHLQVDNYGNFYVSGVTQLFSSNPVVWYPFLMKFDSNGNLLWRKTFDITDTIYNMGSYLFFTLMPDDFILASVARGGQNDRGNMVLFKLDTAGNAMWQVDIGPKERSTSLATSIYSPSDNSYIICGGYLGTEFGSGGLLVKLDTSGNPIFIKQYYAPGADSFQNALVDIYVDQNRIYATGTQYRNYHAWFLSTDLNGCISPGDCGQNIPLSITRSTGGEQDALVVYPNPATTHVFVSCNPAIFKETLHLQLLDVSGRVLWASETESNAFNAQIDLTPFPVGIYVLQVSDGLRNEYVRVMKQ